MIESAKLNMFPQRVKEHSIDWLFCVELNASPKFQSWVAPQLFPGLGEFEHIGAWRSIGNADGETDILWCIDKLPERRRFFALIENKIDAGAQKDQYLRYVKRGNDYVEQKKCNEYKVALIAPEGYSSADSESYKRIHYEEIRNWLQQQGDKRSDYLASLYDSVIKPVKPTDEEAKALMREFKQSIRELSNAEFPQLCIEKPGNVGATDNWVSFRPFVPKSGRRLVYKMNMYGGGGKFKDKPVMDLELAKHGKNTEKLRKHCKSMLAGTGISIEKTEESAVFRLPVPNIESPIFDLEAVRAALQAATRLKDWWEEWGDGIITDIEAEG